MKRFKFNVNPLVMVIITTFVLMGISGTSVLAKAEETLFVPANFSKLAQQARPGVVNIRTVKNVKGDERAFRHFQSPFGNRNPFDDFFGPFFKDNPHHDFKQRSLGSGFIIDKEGFIVTNNHVIQDADQIKVKLANDQEFDATIVGRDPKTDLALIKIEGPADLVPLKMGDSDKLEIGSWVVAIGSPFGLEQTVTAGIVSAKGRTIGSGPYDDFIQTDASINPGNSGGPLLNMQGEVVGINTAIIASGQGIGFAIPAKMAEGIIQQLKEGGTVTRGWLGVGIQSLTPELAEYYGLDDKEGVLVTKVFEGDPAEKGGIKSHDVITAIDGQKVTSGRELSRMIANMPVGKKTDITVIREGKQKTLQVELAKRDDDEMQAQATAENGDELGFAVTEVTPESARQLGYEIEGSGILVTKVASGGKADEAGLEEGDLIKEVNHKPVDTMQSFSKEMKSIDSGKTLQLLVRRGQGGFVVVKMTK
jgi:serine protease Do